MGGGGLGGRGFGHETLALARLAFPRLLPRQRDRRGALAGPVALLAAPERVLEELRGMWVLAGHVGALHQPIGPVLELHDERLIFEVDRRDAALADEETYYFSCPCGDQFSITLEALRRGEDIAPCNSCSLKIKVLYNKDSLQQCKAALPLALAVPVS